jgi:transposase InsO family protein
MSKEFSSSPHQSWAHFRFAVVSHLLIAPPDKDQLKKQLDQVAGQEWRHPITGHPVRFAFSTIERWYYQARKHVNPVQALRRKVRSDAGRCKALTGPVRDALVSQYRNHPGWSCQLHLDNLVALVNSWAQPEVIPSYATVRRFMQATGLLRQKRIARRETEGTRKAEQRLEQREVRSYEAQNVNALWHLDFHHGSRRLSLRNGQWVTPILLGILDDHSRLVCHAQWYLAETAENLIHGLCQALQKRGMPRSLMTDNGAAMIAAETCQGLARLSIAHDTILPYSPYQNGKQEVFWAQVEGRLLPMLEGVTDDALDLTLLNNTTQAWLEQGYHHTIHSETRQTPIERFLAGHDLGRPSPDSRQLKSSFTQQEERMQRRSDGTITVAGVRFEIPSCYRSIKRPTIRYARWDLSSVLLVDPQQDVVLCPLFPQDKTENANGQRRQRVNISDLPLSPPPSKDGVAPLLRQHLAEYAATGLLPAYLHKSEPHDLHDQTKTTTIKGIKP